jgi:hypothetical protein
MRITFLNERTRVRGQVLARKVGQAKASAKLSSGKGPPAIVRPGRGGGFKARG